MDKENFKSETACPDLTNLPPLGMEPADLERHFRHYYTNYLGRDRNCCLTHYHYAYDALALVVRDRLMERWKNLLYRKPCLF